MNGRVAGAWHLRVAQDVRKRPLGAVLLAEGLITAEQLETALLEAEQRSMRLGEVLVANGVLTSRELAIALAAQADLRFVDLGAIELDPAVTTLLPEHFARRHQALPIKLVDEETVMVAIADPTDLLAADDLRLSLGLQIELVVVEAESLALAISRAHRMHIQSLELEVGDSEPQMLDDISDGGAESPPAIKLVNAVLGLAIDEGASDIHFEPQQEAVIVRARIDGVMRQIATVPKALQPAVTSRLKVMGELDIAEKRIPQDGRLTVKYDGQPTDLRIAIMPTAFGEQIVLRIFKRRAGGLGFSLSDLGMSPSNQSAFERGIGEPYGAVVVCGPTGSGKTTTLYAALDVLNTPDRVLMTIEDPVEYTMSAVNQIEVNVKAGLTFARGLRTILRSDPDVLLVGEIRDEETARIAVQAAMTGHLVLTTLHTHNAASSVERLKDMGVQPSLLASSLNCVVAQRLARRLCLDCRQASEPDADELAQLGVEPAATVYRAGRCGQCAGTGYRGRVALYEVLPVTATIRRLFESSTDDILAAAVEEGMTPMRQEGLRLVAAGVSSLEEIRRVTGERT